ncbi:MAG: hypothetical protein ACREMD_03995 [Gemmatimonadota bacterium]
MIGRLKALATGFLIGVFVAPRSGRASRQLLLERLGEFFDEGSRRLEELEEELVGHRRRPTGSRTSEEYEPEPLPDEPIL